MYISTDTRQPELARAAYFADRLLSAEKEKKSELREKFHMDARKRGPKTYPEVFAALKNGKFTLMDLPEDAKHYTAIDSNGEMYCTGWVSFIDFSDPDAPKPDTEGFDAATKKLHSLRKEAEDKLVGETDAAKQLAIFEAFKSTTLN